MGGRVHEVTERTNRSHLLLIFFLATVFVLLVAIIFDPSPQGIHALQISTTAVPPSLLTDDRLPQGIRHLVDGHEP